MAHPGYSRTQLRRAVLSSYLGSVIEYYDFLLYATASAVVFNKIFFSTLDPLVATVASFGTLATGYFARPLGGILFGHYGDRIGRKKMLILSMTLMGVGSTLIGLLLFIANYQLLPETLHTTHKQVFSVGNLMRGYWELGASPRFIALALASGIPFNRPTRCLSDSSYGMFPRIALFVSSATSSYTP